VLRDRSLDRVLHRDGYAVVDLISPDAAHAVRERFGEIHGWSRQQLMSHQPPDFEIALWDDDLDYRREVASIVDDATAAAIEGLFETQRPIGRSLMIKWPAAPGTPSWEGVPDAFHNDSPYVDERSGSRTYGVWLALQDVDLANGCVHVVPHSHRLTRTIRGWGVDAPWLAYDDVYRRRAVPVELRAGQAYVWDPALIHRSGPNRTDEPRVAATILVAEPGGELSIFRRRDDDHAERVRISSTFFLDGTFDALDALPPVEVVSIAMPDLSERAVARHLDRLAATSRLHRAADSIRRR
jgi:hypothetical protein